MSTIAENIDTELRAYAQLLTENGYTVYIPKRDRLISHFLYSREVDGQTYWGDVQRDRPLGGYVHHMPIRPSKDNGSSMYVDDADKLTLEAANLVTRASNWNKVVGTQKNHAPEEWSLRSYEQV